MRTLLLLLSFASALVANPCPFCDPVVLEKQEVVASPQAMVLYNQKPLAEGHILVIPKRHVERFEELSVEEMGEIQELIAQVAKAFPLAYGAQDYFIMQKNGPLAGQSVPHLHFHVFPTKVPIHLLLFKSLLPRFSLSDLEMQEQCQKLRNGIEDKERKT